jgi:hypothetical protein
MWGLGQYTLLGIGVGLSGALGNTLYWVLLLGLREASYNTLLGIVAGLHVALGNALYLVLLLGYARFRTTHFTGHHCLISSDCGNTIY